LHSQVIIVEFDTQETSNPPLVCTPQFLVLGETHQKMLHTRAQSPIGKNK